MTCAIIGPAFRSANQEIDLGHFIGEIRMVGFNFAPRGWALCDGQPLPIAANLALFSLIGTYYGGDGKTTFALPDLRGRMPRHAGRGPGLEPVTMGQKKGSNTHVLQTSELPPHRHTSVATKSPGNSINPAHNIWAADSSASDKTFGAPNSLVTMNAATGGLTGGDQPHSIQNPILAVNFCCALRGKFPLR